MDDVREFLETIRGKKLAEGRFRAILHLMIGRTIQKADGSVISKGITWRELARLLQAIRWDKEAVGEIGLNPSELSPRDRERYWYQAISAAQVNGSEARAEAEELIPFLKKLGYVVH